MKLAQVNVLIKDFEEHELNEKLSYYEIFKGKLIQIYSNLFFMEWTFPYLKEN